MRKSANNRHEKKMMVSLKELNLKDADALLEGGKYWFKSSKCRGKQTCLLPLLVKEGKKRHFFKERASK